MLANKHCGILPSGQHTFDSRPSSIWATVEHKIHRFALANKYCYQFVFISQMYPQSQSQSPKSDSQQPSGVAPFSKQSDIGRAAPRESGETDTGSVFRDPGSTSGGSTSFDNQQNDWIGSTGIAVDQVLQTHYESSDTYNEETVSAETWAEGSNFDLDFRRQQVSAQDNSILTLNEMNPDVASTGGSRRPSVSITSLNRQTSQGQTSQGSAGSEVDDSDELNNRLKSMGIGYGKTPTTSSAPSYSQRPSKVRYPLFMFNIMCMSLM